MANGAATTTAINACDAKIAMQDIGGNLVDISGNSNNVALGFSQQIGMFKPFGSKWPIRLACGKDATLSIDFVYTTSIDEGFQMLKAWYQYGGSRTIRIDTPDSSPGADRYEGDWLLTDFNVPQNSDSADPITVTANFVPTGEVYMETIQ